MNKCRLKEIRKEKGITQEELAKVLGVNKATVSGWECGRNYPSVEKLIELCKYLDVSSDCLFGLEQRKYISVDGLSDDQIQMVMSLANSMRENKG